MTNVTKLPEPGVILDLDIEERDEKDIKPPFIVKVGGRALTFADPGDIDWRDLASVQHPADMIRVSLGREDLQHVQKIEMESWKFNRLMEAYYLHYDLEDKIAEARRRSQFSQA